jgi:hypothetical protein
MFGTGRVQSSLMGKVDDPMSAALDAHRQFVGDEWDQEDDMTVVTVGRFEHVPDQIAARPMETFGTSRI